jgi:hypothetical protein
MEFIEMASIDDALNAAVKGIHPSLAPLIFRKWDLDAGGRPKIQRHNLPKIAAIVCKFSGILVQSYWLMLKGQKRDQDIPAQLNDILLQVWAGHQKYIEGLAVSVLHEASMARPDSSIGQLVNSPEVFVKWGELLNARERRIKEFLTESGKEDWFGMFARLIHALPILSSTQFDGENFIFGGQAIPIFPFLHNSDEIENVLYLYSFEQVQSKPRIVFEDPYSDYTEEIELDEGLPSKHQYLFLKEMLGFTDVREGMLYLFGSGYEHIKNLALAIATAGGSKCEEALTKLIEDNKWSVEDYQKKEREDQEPTLNYKVNFITLVLAQKGPIEVMKDLLRQDRTLMDDYLAFLESRGRGRASEWKRNVKDMMVLRKKSIDGYLDLDRDLKKDVSDSIDLEARCWGVLRAAGLNIESPHPYVESINMRICMIKEWNKRLHGGRYDVFTAGLKIEKLLERTMKFLICFYAGLGAYHKSYENNPTSYELHEEHMINEARETYMQISRRPPGFLIEEFKRLARQSSKGVTDLLLGRKTACDMRLLDDLTKGDYVGIFNRLKHDTGGTPQAEQSADSYAEIFNRLKHDKKKEVTRAEMIKFVSQTYKLFRFLQLGKDFSDEMVDYTLEPVYPMVISFREAHRKRDGLMIYNYEIYSLGETTNFPIRILTPHEYSPDEEYYCIPLYNKSTARWWLEPFLIRCSKFDSVFH